MRTKTLCKHGKTGKISTNSLNGNLNCPYEEKKWFSKDFTKLRQTWRRNIEKREFVMLLFMRSIRSLNPNDYNYKRRINGLIRLKRDKISLHGELELRKSLFRENQRKDWQEIEELRRTGCEETDRARRTRIDELFMHLWRSPTTVSQLLTRIQDLQSKVNSLSDATEICYNPESGSSSGMSHVFQWTLENSESQNLALPRFGVAAWHTGFYGYFRKRFWTTPCSRRTTLCSVQQFKEFGIVFSRIETWHSWKYKATEKWNETRTAEFVNTCTLPKWMWIVESYWWTLFSRWYDWLYEITNLGVASGRISWLSGISNLESQLQDWSMFRKQHIFISQRTGS